MKLLFLPERKYAAPPRALAKAIDGRIVFMDLRKAKVKAHYRQLPNGRTVWIESYTTKRPNAKKVYPANKVLHADETSTTVSNGKGEPQQYHHEKHNEMSQDDIHAHLNSAMTIDDQLGMKTWLHKMGVKDLDTFLGDLIHDEADRAKTHGIEPEFTTRKEALEYIKSTRQDAKGRGTKGIKQHTKEMQDRNGGQVTTYAQAYTNDNDIKSYVDATADKKDTPDRKDHEYAEAKMMRDHSASAIEAAKKEMANIKVAHKLKPEDCPEIAGIAKSTQFFGHQAETLAKLNVLPKAIVDVDMGGGKGLILPADALNLMGQGKVKRPLIVVPGATLEQNASKIHDYTEGNTNVFLISNATINEHFGGDAEKMVEAIHNAPPNTIFMASYDVFSYNEKDSEEGDDYARARKLSAAAFDYVALDEAHNIKNVDTSRFKSMKFLTKAKYKRVASGTFLSNNPADALGQLLFLYPQMAMKKEDFEKKYGRKETAEGVNWTGLKDLRADLNNLGMISLRRSAWLDKLPERNEQLAITKMDPPLKAVYNAVLDDIIDQLEEEMAKNPRMKKAFADDGLGEMDELPPQALAKLQLVSGIADYPHEMAEMMDQKIDAVKQAQKDGKMDDDTLDTLESLMKMKSETRKAIRSLRGMVSPKAKDVYKKIAEHLKDKKNGKYIVFVQRKAAARHILDNMPEELKKHAVYYDASKKAELDDYLKNPNGPKVLIGVDASIKEGVNMQVANGMYRYDHHWSPGNQEQSYARIWRFGQDKPTNFHMGIVDGSIDVPKYARLMTKLHQNMQVTSDIEEPTTDAFKMGLDTIKSKNNADILPQYLELGKNILKFQAGENKELQKRYGKGMFKKATGKPIGGSKAQLQHGLGAMHGDIKAEKLQPLPDKDSDKLLGHFREQAEKTFGKDAIYDQGLYDDLFMDTYKLAIRQRARDDKSKSLDDLTFEQYRKEHDEINDPMSPKVEKFLKTVVNGALAGKAHKSHESHGIEEPLTQMLKKHGLKPNAGATKAAAVDVKLLLSKLGKTRLTHLGEGRVENPEVAEKALAAVEKTAGESLSPRYKKILLGTAAMVQEVSGGWDAIKDEWSHVTDDFKDTDE